MPIKPEGLTVEGSWLKEAVATIMGAPSSSGFLHV